MKPTKLHYAMALQAVPHIGDITAKKLIQHCGTPEAVFKASKKELESIDEFRIEWGCSPTSWKRI